MPEEVTDCILFYVPCFQLGISTLALYLFFRGSCLMFPVHSQFHVTFTLFFLQKSPKPCYICSRILFPKSCFIVVLFCTLLETLAKTLLLNSMWQNFDHFSLFDWIVRHIELCKLSIVIRHTHRKSTNFSNSVTLVLASAVLAVPEYVFSWSLFIYFFMFLFPAYPLFGIFSSYIKLKYCYVGWVDFRLFREFRYARSFVGLSSPKPKKTIFIFFRL